MEERINPYTTTGNAWATPDVITLSFAPDNAQITANNTSSLISSWNAKFGSQSVWQNQVLKAAQTWAVATNINFVVKTDDGVAFGSGDYVEGDPNHGDIRIGGYNFGASTLAWGELPPPGTNYSIAGDIAFNVGQNFNIGSSYDIYSVALHEIGHALGLAHSTVGIMQPTYSTAGSALDADAQNGIRAIYGGARTVDAYDAAASNSSFATASNLTATIDTANKNAVIDRLDITNAVTDTDFYKFTVPTGLGGSASIQVTSAGRSLLAPKFYLYNASQQQIGYVSGLNQYGTTLTINSNLTAGATYYIKVTGADYTAFGTGAYAIAMQFSGGTAPTLANLDVSIAIGDELQHAGSYNQEAGCNCPYCAGSIKTAPSFVSQPDDNSATTTSDSTPVVTIKKSDATSTTEAKGKDATGSIRRDLAHRRNAQNANAHRQALEEWLSKADGDFI